MWRFILLLVCAVLLTGCNTPDPGFRGLPFKRMDVDGSVFDVRVHGGHAEALRVNPQYAPRFGPIRLRAATAIQWASGCRVVDVAGDQARATGRLDCGQGAPPPRTVPLALECVPVRGTEIQEIGQVRIELDCDPA
ncbi:MAG: hypothetical protein AB8B60_07450 [Sulfitobacter sp.]